MQPSQDILNSKILIVDDDVSIGMMIEDVLKDNGFNTVRYISDSRQAKDTFIEFQPDLLMLDINMPHMTGFDVMGQLKELREDTYVPILVLTAEASEDICVQALNAGATDFLDKPMKATEALARIENMLQFRQLHKKLESKKQFLETKVSDRTDQLRDAIVELDKMHQQLKEAYIETIYRLTRATEYKDEETANHVRRLSLYSVALGKEIGLSDSHVELLLYSAPMHDVGKIGIPDKILFKPEGLTKDEWEVMKSHTSIGHEILRNSEAPILKMGATIALNHHERYDGSGYPNGLKGEDIPIEARILSLVDVYDALRSKRHYKEPFSHEKTCKIILEGDGRVEPKHFDPKLLEAFSKIHEVFEKIFEDNVEEEQAKEVFNPQESQSAQPEGEKS